MSTRKAILSDHELRELEARAKTPAGRDFWPGLRRKWQAELAAAYTQIAKDEARAAKRRAARIAKKAAR